MPGIARPDELISRRFFRSQASPLIAVPSCGFEGPIQRNLIAAVANTRHVGQRFLCNIIQNLVEQNTTSCVGELAKYFFEFYVF